MELYYAFISLCARFTIGNSSVAYWKHLGAYYTHERTIIMVVLKSHSPISVFQDCFDPIIDAESGRDLIPAMVYG